MVSDEIDQELKVFATFGENLNGTLGEVSDIIQPVDVVDGIATYIAEQEGANIYSFWTTDASGLVSETSMVALDLDFTAPEFTLDFDRPAPFYKGDIPVYGNDIILRIHEEAWDGFSSPRWFPILRSL
jgi:hypothetical protein